ncbi:MAG: hypothetical protein H7144_04920 [Burkholderiales bacterium]|nr:hypothetical protein [Phycisphaerae bacterium]
MKPGPRSQITPEMWQRILALIEGGLPIGRAAVIAGTDRHAVRRFAMASRASRAALKKAEAESEYFHVLKIRDGKQGWKRSAWFLQVKWPQRWGERKSSPDPQGNQSLILCTTVIQKEARR